MAGCGVPVRLQGEHLETAGTWQAVSPQFLLVARAGAKPGFKNVSYEETWHPGRAL